MSGWRVTVTVTTTIYCGLQDRKNKGSTPPSIDHLIWDEQTACSACFQLVVYGGCMLHSTSGSNKFTNDMYNVAVRAMDIAGEPKKSNCISQFGLISIWYEN